MIMIVIVTITIIILTLPGWKRGDGNAALHIRSNVGLSKRSHSFTLNPREAGWQFSIMAHIYYFVCSLIFTCKTSNLQIERVVDAWDWTSDDSVLHCIGLGSTYGLINSLQVIFHCVEDGFKVFLRVICISFSGTSLNGCKNNPHAPVRPTQGECSLCYFFLNKMMVKIGKCLTDSWWTLITCTLLSLK